MSSISAGTTTGTALVSTGDTTGQLDLKINGTTQAVRINTSGAIGVGTGPSFGTSGQVLTSAGSSAAPTWEDAATVNNTGYRKYIYDASTTWTKQANLEYVQVTVVGAGGGGGSAELGSTDQGQAGNSGAIGYKKILAASLGSTETVTIGSGGAGGAGGTNDGSDGGNSSFGSHVTANGGSGGYYATSPNRATQKPANTSSGGDINYESAYLGNTSAATVSAETNTLNLSSSSAYWASTLPISVRPGALAPSTVGGLAIDSYAYGIGGGGADGDGISDFDGGDGYKGVVIVEEFYNLT